MDNYKNLWNKLKTQVEDDNVLNLMKQLETTTITKKKRKPHKYYISLSSQPWYKNYLLVREIIWNRSKRGTINKDLIKTFDTDFMEWTKKVSLGEKTTEELGEWLKERHQEFQSKESGKIQGAKQFKKSKFTKHGFERKHRWELSLEEKAAIMIDELMNIFTPNVPKDFDLNIEYYREDWEQELWIWCWEYRYKDPNLNSLILNYNKLTKSEYKFRVNNILSRMNTYIIPYIARLQYSCNDIANWRLSRKFIEEELYPADDINISCEQSIEDVSELFNSYPNEILDLLFKELKNYIQTTKSSYAQLTKVSYERYKIILEMRYGFNSENKTYTYEEIGKCLNITKQRAKQMEIWVLKQLKYMIKYKKLDTLWED